jgi:outer membrane lipoprotein-sorting protein
MKTHRHSRLTNFFVKAIWVLSLVSCWTSTASSQGPTVDQVIAGNEAAIGGLDVLKPIEEIRLTANVTFGSNADSTSMVVTMKRPNLMYTVTTSSAGKVISGFDGTTAWLVDPQTGVAAPLAVGQSTASNMSSPQMDSTLGYLRAMVAGQAVQMIGSDEVNSIKVYHIRATRSDGNIFDYYIDQITFLIAKTSTQIQQGGVMQLIESYPTKYQKLNGVTLPYSLDVRVAGQPAFEMQIQQVELNPVVDAGLFNMPQPSGGK